MMTALFVLVAAAAGVAQAVLLGHSARREPSPMSILARLTIVGGVLTLAALSGHLLAAVVGWALGFTAAAVVVRRRLR